jgi:hypothetical protein
VIIMMAGSIAQKLFFPRVKWQEGHGIRRDMHGYEYSNAESDVYHIEHMLDGLHQGNDKVARLHRQYLEARTNDLVQANRERVGAVAKALLERKTLTHGEVYDIIFPPDADDVVGEDLAAAESDDPVFFVDREGRTSDLLLAVCKGM